MENKDLGIVLISLLICSALGFGVSWLILNPKIVSLETMLQNSLNDYNDRLTAFETEINEANTNISQLRESLDEVQEDINRLDEHVNQTLEEIKDGINILNEEINARLEVIISDLVTIQESVSNLQDDIASIQNQEWHRAIRVVEEPGSGEKSYVTDMFELSGGDTRVRFYFRGMSPASEINIWVVFRNGTRHTHRGSSGYWGSYSTLVTGTPKGEYYLIIETEDITRFIVYVWDYYDENEFTPASTSSNGVSLQPTNPYNTIVPYSLQTVTIDGDLDLDGEYSDAVWFVIETPNYYIDGYMQYNDEDLFIGMNIPDTIRWGSQIAIYFDLDDNGAMQSGIDLVILWHGDPHGGPYAGWLSNPLEDAGVPITYIDSDFQTYAEGYQVEFSIPMTYFSIETVPFRARYSPDTEINYTWDGHHQSSHWDVSKYGQITFV